MPVPPPNPAVMNARSQPSTSLANIGSDSNAACSPFSGSPPAPLPRAVLPISIFSATLTRNRCCASVFTARPRTFSLLNNPSELNLAIVFDPQPPQPNTLMLGWRVSSSLSKSSSLEAPSFGCSSGEGSCSDNLSMRCFTMPYAHQQQNNDSPHNDSQQLNL